MSLANTSWTLTDGSGYKSTVKFGQNSSTVNGTTGGYGTVTVHYGGNTGDITNDMVWIEDGNGQFMYEVKGPPDNGVNQLPTVTGTYRGTSALGWGTNFDQWGVWDVQMTNP